MRGESHEGVDTNELDERNSMSSQLGALVLAISKRLLKDFMNEIHSFYSNNNYHLETNSSDIHKTHWAALDRKEIFGEELRQIEKFNFDMRGYFMACS